MDKHQIIAGCKRNKRRAQNELFRLYDQLVMTISMRYSSNRAQCEDIFQDCFIQIFKSLSRNKKDVVDLDRWVARVAINTNISHYYKAQKMEMEPFADDHLNDHHKVILDAMSVQELLTIINSLPDGYRVIVNMYFIDGFKHKEIAKALNITESTSRSQLTRAKELLRTKLEHHGIFQYEAS